MSHSPNQDQIDYWNGEAGTNWVAAQERLDQMLAPLSAQVLHAAAAQPGESVLDVGCGCGATALQMARAGARVTGVDISEPMLGRARERAADYPDLRFEHGDAAAARFDQAFDLVFSRFGVMFFADPATAFANLRRHQSGSGRLCFICWKSPADNPWISLPVQAAQPFLPPPEPPPADAPPGPFAFAEPAFVEDVLGRAGYQNVRMTPVEEQIVIGRNQDDAMTFLTRIGPLSQSIRELEDAVRQSLLQAVADAIAPHAGPDGIAMTARCWIVQADNA